MQNELWKSTEDWFAHWFNCEAYHILYGSRDDEEAGRFVRALADRVCPLPPARVLDLACGSGRHVRRFEELGYTAFGVDLSPESIAQARAQSAHPERYRVADMRTFAEELGTDDAMDVVTCLFTSFGYFSLDADQMQTLFQVRKALRSGGKFILDFLNVPYVRAHLVPHERAQRLTASGKPMEFEIHRRIHGGWIEKSIQFRDDRGTSRHFVERVRALESDALSEQLHAAGFHVEQVYGNYELAPHSESSNRCIFVAS